MLWLMLLDERIATGSARRQPMTVPRMDIFMVSISGETTFGKNDQLGRNIFASRSSHLAELAYNDAPCSKPVICSESHMASASSNDYQRRAASATAVRSGRLQGLLFWGLKMLVIKRDL